MQWTSGRVLAKVPAPLVAPLVDVMLDHGAEAFEVALGLMVSCAHGTPGKIAGLRPQIRADSQIRRELHPVETVDEFGDREGVLQAMLDNMHNFTWSGSLASHFALYEKPLRALRDHPKPKVRRWARATLRGLAAKVETVHEEEEEQKARWEA